MDEIEWKTTTNIERLIIWLRSVSTPRKMRLYLCACNRRISHLFFRDNALNHVGVAEQMADGLASQDDILLAQYLAESPTFGLDFGHYSLISTEGIEGENR